MQKRTARQPDWELRRLVIGEIVWEDLTCARPYRSPQMAALDGDQKARERLRYVSQQFRTNVAGDALPGFAPRPRPLPRRHRRDPAPMTPHRPAPSAVRSGPRRTLADMTDLAWETDADPVVWTVRADDPWTIIDRPDDGDPYTAEDVAAEVAADHDMVLEHVIDYDEIDGANYYEWSLIVPRDQHDQRDADRAPAGVEAVISALRQALLDESLRWSAYVDGDGTRDLHAAAVVRQAHLPLVEALEDALLPLRVDGAEHAEPHIRAHQLKDGRLRASYAIYLCEQPPNGPWCLLRAGIADDLPVAPTHTGHNDLSRGQFVLPLPVPAAPTVYGAEVTIGPFDGLSSRWENSPGVVGWGGDKRAWPGVGGRFQWLSNDPKALADRIARTVELWWPEGATPPATSTTRR